MNLQAPVSSLMTTNLITVEASDKLQVAKDIFGTHNIHHLPVMKDDQLVGIFSKSDYLYFIRPLDRESNESYLNDLRLKNYTIAEAMSPRVVSISSKESLKMALEVLTENLFHALPVVDDGKLVGIITTHDILFRLLHPAKIVNA